MPLDHSFIRTATHTGMHRLFMCERVYYFHAQHLYANESEKNRCAPGYLSAFYKDTNPAFVYVCARECGANYNALSQWTIKAPP